MGRKANPTKLLPRVVSSIRNSGCNVVLGNNEIVDISKMPKNNFTVSASKRRYFYPVTQNWVTYQRARGLLNKKGIDLFKLPENQVPEVKSVAKKAA